jgi:rhodanese-related sulfurtransferase
MKSILSIFSVTAVILIGLFASISAAESVSTSAIPDELIARQLKKYDASMAISVEAVLYKLKRNRPLTLVDVRRQQDFERLHIPGSINLPLYAVKTKTFLKSSPVVLVNEGFDYSELQSECQRLAGRGYEVFILDGGLPAWKRKDGRLTGDLLALDEMKAVSPQIFLRAKDYENTEVVDISLTRSDASNRLFPYAKHIPILHESNGSIPELKGLNKKNRPFQSIVILNETGEQYEKAEIMMNRLGIEVFHLKGGTAAYQKYLAGLMLSWKSRDSRMKKVGNCRPCGQEEKNDSLLQRQRSNK